MQMPDIAARQRIPRVRPSARLLDDGLVLASGVAAFALIRATGMIGATDDALGAMGFDPDRAELITALVAEAIVIAAATIPRGPSRWALFAGVIVAVDIFIGTFVRETAADLTAPPVGGHFDPLGWATTLVALTVVVVGLGSATSLLVGAARAAIATALGELRDVVRGRAGPRRSIRPIASLAIAAVALATLPVFADMVNYDPDVRMIAGGAAATGAAASVADASRGSVGATGSTSIFPSVGSPVVPGSGPGPALATDRPWLAWRPAGSGHMAYLSLPAPWTGGTSPTASVAVYTPPGYAGGDRRYPVLYELPFGVSAFENYIHIQEVLDNLITSGSIPATLVVFVSESGGPYPDSECIDSADGREWFERYVTGAVVPFVDTTYRTIARPEARALFGFSQGGYCAPMLLFRHPDVFSSAISFSGYFQAAIRSAQTPNAWRPYGGDPALITATSPIDEVTQLPSGVASSLFVAVSASPGDPFYGPQYRSFVTAAKARGVALALFPTPLGHSWRAVREQLSEVLATLAARETRAGIFSS